jgi:hypothetical protein
VDLSSQRSRAAVEASLDLKTYPHYSQHHEVSLFIFVSSCAATRLLVPRTFYFRRKQVSDVDVDVLVVSGWTIYMLVTASASLSMALTVVLISSPAAKLCARSFMLL